MIIPGLFYQRVREYWRGGGRKTIPLATPCTERNPLEISEGTKGTPTGGQKRGSGGRGKHPHPPQKVSYPLKNWSFIAPGIEAQREGKTTGENGNKKRGNYEEKEVNRRHRLLSPTLNCKRTPEEAGKKNYERTQKGRGAHVL